MYPAIFEQLLLFVEFSCKPPQYGKVETKHVANAKYNQVGGHVTTTSPLWCSWLPSLLGFVGRECSSTGLAPEPRVCVCACVCQELCWLFEGRTCKGEFTGGGVY